MKKENFSEQSFWGEVFNLEDGSCGCTLCQIVKSRQSVFPVRSKTSKVFKKYKNKLCSKCLSKIARGLSHTCNLKSMTSNVQQFLHSEWKPAATEQVASKLLKNIFEEKKVRPNDCVKLKQVNCKPSKIFCKPKNKPELNTISHYDMLNLKTSLNLSMNETKTAATILRSGSRKKIESNLSEIISASSHVLDDYFESSTFEFITEIKDVTKKHVQEVVVCKDLSKFIDYVVKDRNLKDYYLKFGIDGGGKFLKICLSIQDTSGHKDSDKSKSNFKDSGVKKLFILAIAQSTQENYHNVKLLWDKLNINKFLSEQMDGTVTTDLKLANILFGLMSHSASYPCTWCVARKGNLAALGELRTTLNCIQNFEKYEANKKDKKKSKGLF